MGIGTGRCGTVSLARIVDACERTLVWHENPAFRLPWASREDGPLRAFAEHAAWGRANRSTIGDVALYWLPHVERLRELVPDLKVICLRRDRDATIASLERKMPGYTTLRLQDRPHLPEWWDVFPRIEAPTIRAAWEAYYDAYYERASSVRDVLHVRTEQLDEDATLRAIFDYLEIPLADRRYRPDRRHNTSAETVVARSRRQQTRPPAA